MTKKNIRVTNWILIIAMFLTFSGVSSYVITISDPEIETLVLYLIAIAFAIIAMLFKKVPVDYILPYRNGTNIKNVLLVLGIAITSTPLTTAIYTATSLLIPEAFDQNAMLASTASEGLFYVVLIYAITPAIGEEFFCRGLVYGSLRQSGHVKTAIVVSALFFGFLHMNFTQFFYAFTVGLVFAIELEKTGCIWLTMLHHFINNCESPIETYCKTHSPGIAKFLHLLNLDYSGHFWLSAIITVISTALLIFLLSKLSATPKVARARAEMDDYIKKDRARMIGRKPTGISPILIICFIYLIAFTVLITYTDFPLLLQ